MGKDRKQLSLTLAPRNQSPDVLTPQAECELLQALAELLLAVARANAPNRRLGGKDDERKNR
jgi:hypothetical protein